MEDVQIKRPQAGRGRERRTWTWAWPVASLLILAGLLWAFVALNPLARLTQGMPAVEELTIDRVAFGDYGMRVHVTNGSPQPVTVSQVLVDEAYWDFSAEPDATLPRLGRATFTVPYPWVEGEPHEVMLMTESGATFTREVEVAVATPETSGDTFAGLGLLGLYVGVVPVMLGLFWYPAIRGMGRRGREFVLALTIGLLGFLVFDTSLEALELAGRLTNALDGQLLFWITALASFLLLTTVTAKRRAGRRTGLALAVSIALGIGLHNLGEGLAIGAAFAQGEAALGSFLVVGFTLHNLTEGIGIAAPLPRGNTRLRHFIGLAALAGAPAILGTWVGAFSFNPLASLLFLAVGAGAIAQVIIEVGRLLHESGEEEGWDGSALAGADWVTWTGVVGGFLIMYGTSLWVGV